MADVKQVMLVNDKLTKIDVTSDIELLHDVLVDITQNTNFEIQLKGYFDSVFELYGLLSKFNFEKQALVFDTKKELEKVSPD